MGVGDRLAYAAGLIGTMRRARLIAPMRPDKYLRIAAAMQRENMGITSGFASAAQRCPDNPGLVDELGTLTWREIDQRADAFAAALQGLPKAPQVLGIMARNHRGFVEALVAANRIGADVLLLNTSFAGPALAEVLNRERGLTSLAVIYDEEFTTTVDRALADDPDVTRIVAWTDGVQDGLTVEKMLDTDLSEVPTGEVGSIYVRNSTQRLAGFVVLNPGASAAPEDLNQHVRDNLANYKVPREITVLDEMPRNNTGKIVRRELQARVNNG